MPRKFFKKISPDPRQLSKHKSLRWLDDLMHRHDIWSFKRSVIAKAVAIGIFCGMIPMPFQMLLAAFLAYRLSANLPISVALVWISNPLTMPAIYFFQYKLGSLIMGDHVHKPAFELSIEWFYHQIGNIWQPFLLGAFICALVGALVGYVLVNRFWVWQVRKNWHGRKK